MLLCCWSKGYAKGYKEPLYLLTNMASADEACGLYTKRFRIETFFSDQKSRGFHLDKSHLASCPYELLGLKLPTHDWRTLLHMDPKELEQELLTQEVRL